MKMEWKRPELEALSFSMTTKSGNGDFGSDTGGGKGDIGGSSDSGGSFSDSSGS